MITPLELKLLDHAPSPEVLDLMISPFLANGEDLPSLPFEPSPSTIKLIFKGAKSANLQALAAVAKDNTVLEKLSKDKRKDVQIALTRNRSLPSHLLGSLLSKGLENDERLLTSILSTFTFEEVIGFYQQTTGLDEKTKARKLLRSLVQSWACSPQWFQWMLEANNTFASKPQGATSTDAAFSGVDSWEEELNIALSFFFASPAKLPNDVVFKAVMDPVNGFLDKRITLCSSKRNNIFGSRYSSADYLADRFSGTPEYNVLKEHGFFSHRIEIPSLTVSPRLGVGKAVELIETANHSWVTKFSWTADAALFLMKSLDVFEAETYYHLLNFIDTPTTLKQIFSAAWEETETEVDPESFILPQGQQFERFLKMKYHPKGSGILFKVSGHNFYSYIRFLSAKFMTEEAVEQLFFTNKQKEVALALLSNPKTSYDQRFLLCDHSPNNLTTWLSTSSVEELQRYLHRFDDDQLKCLTPQLIGTFNYTSAHAQTYLKMVPLKNIIAGLGSYVDEKSSLFIGEMFKELTSALGEHPLKWSTFLTLVKDWSRPAHELVEAVEILT